MKRILLLFLALSACFSLAFGLSSCKAEHVHSYSPYWSFDAEYHWHACEGNCNSYIDKEKHNWDGGTTTQEADEETTGIKTYRCLTCGAEKTEKFQFDASNGPTTTVREDQMKRAFDGERFKNVTMIFNATDSGKFLSNKIYLFTEQGAYWYELDEDGNIIYEQYYVTNDTNGYDVYTKGKDGNWYVESMSEVHFVARYVNYAARFAMQYVVFADYYNDFSYDEIDRNYQLVGKKVAGNNISYAVIGFEAKQLTLLAFLRPIGNSLDFSTEFYGNLQEFRFENYGETTFELPTGAIPLN